jgi:response regulator RpfG family c-di-GMP phosphodiesterase
MSQQPMTASQASKKRPILVVDDEPEMLYSLQGLLRRNFQVYTANSGAEGLKILQEHEVHVVMTDQRMPEMTGVEFLKRLNGNYPEAIRVIFTGYADTQAVIDAINQGNVFRYVAKPWDPEELTKTLNEAGRRYDQIIACRTLLRDLRDYEARCVSFDEEMRNGRHGTLGPEAIVVADQLRQTGRSLVERIAIALESPQVLTQP